MGVHLYLRVLRHAIDPAAWAELYDELLRLLRAHPSGLLGYDTRALLGRLVPVYTRDVERTHRGRREICVVGDRRSLRTGEAFCLPRDLHAGWRTIDRTWPRATCTGPWPRPSDDDGDDLVLHPPEARRGWLVFGEKTQGEAYHQPILAAAMVVESRFPGAALAFGDFDEAQALEAKAWAEGVLGREVALPVLLDAPALLVRLRARWQGEALIAAFLRRFRGIEQEGLGHALAAVERPIAESWLLDTVRRPERFDDERPEPEIAIQGWLIGTGDVARLAELACHDRRGPRMPPARLAEMIGASWALVPTPLRERAERCRRASLSSRPDVSMLGAFAAAIFFERRTTSCRVDPGAVEAAFARVFPGRAAELLACARAEGKKLEETIAALCEAIEHAAWFLGRLEPFQDVGDLAALRSADELAPTRRRELAVFALGLRRRWSNMPVHGPGSLLVSGANPKGAHRLFIAAACGTAPTLTEEAWDWILREEEPALLRLLIRVFNGASRTRDGRVLERAILESRVLCAEVARMMVDDAVMAEAEALVEEQRRREAERAGEAEA